MGIGVKNARKMLTKQEKSGILMSAKKKICQYTVSEKGKKMKSLGIVRKIDELGRIVLPIETRRQLDLEPKDGVEIFVHEDQIILKKYEPCCIFCGDANDIVLYRDKKICKKCLAELKQK